MNKLNVAIFKLIINSAETFKSRMNETLLEYRGEMEKARKYAVKFKDEESVLQSQRNLLRATAQEKIRKAQRVFSSELERYTDQLSDQLHSHVSEPLDAGFRDQLLTIAQFGLRPSKTQIEALLKANSGNAIGIEALSKVLSDVESPYQVQFRSIEDYEKDLQKIRDLMTDPIAYDIDGTSVHHEAVEVMSSVQRLFTHSDGTTYTRGYCWENTSLLIACRLFDNTVEDIEKMQDSWISDVSFREVEALNAAEELKEELLESVNDVPEPDEGNTSETEEEYESSTKILESDSLALKLAKEIGKDKARGNAPIPKEVKGAYIR